MTAPFAVPDWPAAAKNWKLGKIKPYPNNARTHPPGQITLLATMLKRWGPDQPIVVDEQGVILKGHGRLLAAKEAGFEEFPVVQRRGLPETEKTAMRLADNQVALLSGWDVGLVKAEMNVLKLAGYEMPLIGFRDKELVEFGFGPEPQTDAKDPDEIPEPPKKPTARVGDVWLLGNHRLVVGDSTDPKTWTTLMDGEQAAMVFTDPPYGVSYKARSGEFAVIKGDDKRQDDLYQMLIRSLRCMVKAAADASAFYIWHASSTREDFAQAMKAVGIIERQYLIWVKTSIVLGHSDYRWQHEPVFYASRGERAPKFYGDRAESTIWHVQIAERNNVTATVGNGLVLLNGEGEMVYLQSRAPKNKKLRHIRVDKGTNVFISTVDQGGTIWEVGRDSGGYDHPTQKPVELARRAIVNSSQQGEIVVDGFLGSGTTLIGAEMTSRRCFGVELDPIYGDVGICRWQKFSGQSATLEATGKTYAAVAAERAAPARTQPAPAPARSRARPAEAKGSPKKGKAPKDAPPPVFAPATARRRPVADRQARSIPGRAD